MRVSLSILIVLTAVRLAAAAPATQPSNEDFARARAAAEAMVQPSGPILGPRVAFEPVPPPATRFAGDYNRYVYTIPAPWYGFGCYGFGLGWGWGWGWGCGWGGSFGVGGSYQNSSGGVGW